MIRPGRKPPCGTLSFVRASATSQLVDAVSEVEYIDSVKDVGNAL